MHKHMETCSTTVHDIYPFTTIIRLCYGVATIRRLLKIIGLFCRISSLLLGSFAKETYNFKQTTNRSHPVCRVNDIVYSTFVFIKICIILKDQPTPSAEVLCTSAIMLGLLFKLKQDTCIVSVIMLGLLFKLKQDTSIVSA